MSKQITPKALKSNVVAQEFGGPARGAALATAVWGAVTASMSGWARYARDLISTDAEARKTFRHDLNMKKKEASAADKAANTKMTRSAFNRISELYTITKAADLGLTVAECVGGWNAKGIIQHTAETLPYPFILEMARAFLREKGAADGRGQSTKVISPEEKARKFMLVNINPAQYPAILTMLQKLAKTVKTEEQAKAMLDSMKPKAKNSGAADGRDTAMGQISAAISDNRGATPASVTASVKRQAAVRKADKVAVAA